MADGLYRGRYFSEWTDEVKSLKRAGRLDDALTLLFALVDVIEDEARGQGWPVAPWYYEQIAIIFRKKSDLSSELAILERYHSHPAGRGSMGPTLAARLRKVRELIAAAEEAAGPVACPECGVLLERMPSSAMSCPECGAKLVVRKRAGQQRLFTRDQAAALKVEDEQARERERCLVLAARLGFDEDAFDRESDKLSKRFGSAARPGDVYWALSNKRVLDLAKDGDRFGLPAVYADQAKFLQREGRDWFQAATARLQATRDCLTIHPELRFMLCPCGPCQKVPKRTYTHQELRSSMPAPHRDCEKPPCGCSLAPRWGENVELRNDEPADDVPAPPQQAQRRSLFKRLFG